MTTPDGHKSTSDQGDGERLTRREAADRLTDLAYALTVGGPFTLGDGEVAGEVPDELEMKRRSTTENDRVAVQLELSWRTRRGPNARRGRRT